MKNFDSYKLLESIHVKPGNSFDLYHIIVQILMKLGTQIDPIE